jgi:hypothetical protein
MRGVGGEAHQRGIDAVGAGAGNQAEEELAQVRCSVGREWATQYRCTAHKGDQPLLAGYRRVCRSRPTRLAVVEL